MKKFIFLLIVLVAPFIIKAQDATEEEKDFGIKWSGYVKNDFFYDSRQTVSIREGHFLLYPANESLDNMNQDINANPSLNMLAIQSRLTGKISGPDAFGAKTSGAIEADFFGNENGSFADVNGFRLRHAFVKLNWEKVELLTGQYWNPLFVTDCFPDVVSFNTGVPFQPFSRNPQIRLTYKAGSLNVMVAALAQRDFTSPGGSTGLRNTAVPDLHGQIMFKSDNLVAGLGGSYKMLTPEIVSTSNYKTNSTVNGMSGQAFFKFKTDMVTLKLEGVYGQNLYDVLMLGGYAVKDFTNSVKSYKEYTTLNNYSAWAEVYTNPGKIAVGKGDVQVGVFGGYTKNIGSLDVLDNWKTGPAVATRGFNIDYVYRVSPRIIYASGKTKFCLEVEYTTAAYGKDNNQYGEVLNSEEISNIRGLLSVIYNF